MLHENTAQRDPFEFALCWGRKNVSPLRTIFLESEKRYSSFKSELAEGVHFESRDQRASVSEIWTRGGRRPRRTDILEKLEPRVIVIIAVIASSSLRYILLDLDIYSILLHR